MRASDWDCAIFGGVQACNEVCNSLFVHSFIHLFFHLTLIHMGILFFFTPFAQSIEHLAERFRTQDL